MNKRNISEKFLHLSSSLSFDKSCVEDKDIKSYVNTSLHKSTFELNLCNSLNAHQKRLEELDLLDS